MSETQNDFSNDEFEKVEAADQDEVVSSSSPADMMAEAESEQAFGGFGETGTTFSAGDVGSNEPLISFGDTGPIPETTVTESTPPPVVSETKFDKLVSQETPAQVSEVPAEGCWMKNVDPRDEVTSSDNKGRSLIEEMDETSPQKSAESPLAHAALPGPFDGEHSEEVEVNKNNRHEEEFDSDSIVSSSDNEYSSSADESDSEGSDSDIVDETAEMDVEHVDSPVGGEDVRCQKDDGENVSTFCEEVMEVSEGTSSEMNENCNSSVDLCDKKNGDLKSAHCESGVMESFDGIEAEVLNIAQSGEVEESDDAKVEEEKDGSVSSSVLDSKQAAKYPSSNEQLADTEKDAEKDPSSEIKFVGITESEISSVLERLTADEEVEVEKDIEKDAPVAIKSDNSEHQSMDSGDMLSDSSSGVKLIGITESEMSNVLEKLTADEDEYIDNTSPVVSDNEKDMSDSKDLSSENSGSSDSDTGDDSEIDSDISGDEIQIGVWSPSPLHEEGNVFFAEELEDTGNKGESVGDSSTTSSVLTGYEYQSGETEDLSNEPDVSDSEPLEAENELNELRQDVKGLMVEIETLVHEDTVEETQPLIDQSGKNNLNEAIDMFDDLEKEETNFVSNRGDDVDSMQKLTVNETALENTKPRKNSIIKETCNQELLHVTFQSPTNTIFYDPESPIVERVAVEVSDELIDYDDEAKDLETSKESTSLETGDNLEAEVVKDLKDVYHSLEAKGEIEGAMESINDIGLENHTPLTEAIQHINEPVLVEGEKLEEGEYYESGISTMVEDTEVLLRRKNNKNAMISGDAESSSSTDSVIVHNLAEEDAGCRSSIIDRSDIDSIIVKDEEGTSLKHVIETFEDDSSDQIKLEEREMKEIESVIVENETKVEDNTANMIKAIGEDEKQPELQETVGNVVEEMFDSHRENIQEETPSKGMDELNIDMNIENLGTPAAYSETFMGDNDTCPEGTNVKVEESEITKPVMTLETNKTLNTADTDNEFTGDGVEQHLQQDIDRTVENYEQLEKQTENDVPVDIETKAVCLNGKAPLDIQEHDSSTEIKETEGTESDNLEDVAVQKDQLKDDEYDTESDHEAFNSSLDNTVIEIKSNMNVRESVENALDTQENIPLLANSEDQKADSQSEIDTAEQVKSEERVPESYSAENVMEEVSTENVQSGMVEKIVDLESFSQKEYTSPPLQEEILEQFVSSTKNELETLIEEVAYEEDTRDPGQNGPLNLSGKKLMCLMFLLASQVLELIYWRDVKKTGVVFGSMMFVLLSLSLCSLMSVLAYLSLAILTVTFSFRVYKNVMQAVQKTNEGHPFKKMMDMEIELRDDVVQNAAEKIATNINNCSRELRRLYLVGDYIDSLKFGLLLWLLTYVGSWFNGMTLVILGVVFLFTLPKLYETYQGPIDQNLNMVRGQWNNIMAQVSAKIPFPKKKVKAQ